MEVLLGWEQLIQRYELAANERISETIRVATVMGFAPKSVKDLLQSSPMETRHSYRLMRLALKEYSVDQSDSAYVPRMHDPDAMGVGGISRSGSEWDDYNSSVGSSIGAIGFDKPTRSICGKIGHSKVTCWFKDAKGSGGKKGKR